MAWVCVNCEANNPPERSTCVVCDHSKDESKRLEKKKADVNGSKKEELDEKEADPDRGLIRSSLRASAVVVLLSLTTYFSLTFYGAIEEPIPELPSFQSSSQTNDKRRKASKPVANQDVASTTDTKSVIVDVLKNDFDPNEQELQVDDVKSTSRGKAEYLGNGNVKFTPRNGSEGTFYVSYVISNSDGKKDTSIVEISVVSVGIEKIRVWRYGGLRSEPSASSDVKVWVPQDSKLELLDVLGNFYRVRYQGDVFYVKEDLVRPEDRR